MSLADFIEKLQKKPRYVRVQIMWVVVFVCMVAIFGFWLWSLRAEQTKIMAGQGQKSAFDNFNQIKEDIPSLWQSLGAGIGGLFNSINEEIENRASIESASPSPSFSSSPMPESLPVE